MGLLKKLTEFMGAPNEDDTMCVRNYSNSVDFAKDAKRMGRKGWRVVSQSSDRGILGLFRSFTVTYVREPEDAERVRLARAQEQETQQQQKARKKDRRRTPQSEQRLSKKRPGPKDGGFYI
jgi:hypothetical protein